MAKIGRYEIVREIGRGSMGVVYLAHDPHVRRPVALKTFVLPHGLSEEQVREYKERFLREAQAAGALSHSAIVTVYDAGTDSESGVPFIAMEYVEGRSLKQILTEGRRLDPAQAIDMADTVAGALAVAHEAGIVHRDIKPANILVRDRDGAMKIVDFGVARLSSSELTGAGDVFGSPAYMAPEQFRGVTADGRSDLFSLSVILYQALTGERPFAGEDLSSLAYTVVHSEPQPLGDLAEGLPEGLEGFFARALAKDPGARYQDADEFRVALAEATGFAMVGPSRDAENPRSQWRQFADLARRRLTPAEAAFAGLMLALVLLPFAWALYNGSLSVADQEGLETAQLIHARTRAARVRSATAADETVAGSAGRNGPGTGSMESGGAAGRTLPGAGNGVSRGQGDPDAQPPTLASKSGRAAASRDPVASKSRSARRKDPAAEAPQTSPPQEAPAIVAEVLPAPLPEPPPPPAQAWLVLNGRSKVKDGQLTLLVDGREAFSRPLSLDRAESEGVAVRKKWFARKEENFQARVEIAPGKHEIVARVRSAGKDSTDEDRAVIEVDPQATLTLELLAGRLVGPPVSFKKSREDKQD